MLVAALLLLAAANGPYDVVIRNGRIVDGSGSPWYSGDIGIRQGRIARIGNLTGATAKRTIDARGMVVAPGFIDMLGQSELTILVNPHLPSKIYQGITTEITGEGSSVAPVSDAMLQADRLDYEHYGIHPDWRTFREYFARLEKQGMGINLASYVGATQVRRMVLGDDDRAPNADELARMKALVRQAMQEGAVGVSTSLQYAPAPYASTEELIALAAEAARFGGIYATHMRSESDAIIPALEEAIRIGREAHIPVEIWHLKTAGKANWGRMPEVVAHIQQARDSGVDITADTYAYPAGFNTFSAIIPPWAHDGGDAKLIERLKDPAMRARIRQEMESRSGNWENEWQEITGPESILVGAVQNPKLLPVQGKTIAQIAKLWGKDPIDTIFDLLIEDRAFTQVAIFTMSEPDIAVALEQPWVSICNDSQGTALDGLLGKEHPHPRAYGTFPRIIGHYVRDEGLIPLEQAVYKMTGGSAKALKLRDRGLLREGWRADIAIFDPADFRDRATYADPHRYPSGARTTVIVNGVVVVDEALHTGALPGVVLRCAPDGGVG